MIPLAYDLNPGGLNNQKLALLGLFLAAHARRTPLALPDLCALDAAHSRATRRPLPTVFDPKPLRAFAVAHGIRIARTRPRTTDPGWTWFEHGANHLAALARQEALLHDPFVRGFFAALQPLILRTPLAARLADRFAAVRIQAVLQLRIERDWQDHVALHLGRTLQPGPEDYAPDPARIIEKAAAAFGPETTRILVVCDESGLIQPKDHLRALGRSRRIDLFWKSDFMSPREAAALDHLDLSLLDFHFARTAPRFAGTSRSSFANLATLEAALANADPTPDHYAWNPPGPIALRRHDQGTTPDPTSATTPRTSPAYLQDP